MQVVETLRRLQANGTGRIANAISDWQAPWSGRRKRSHRMRRLLWATGFMVGFLAIVGLVCGVLWRQVWGGEEGEEEESV